MKALFASILVFGAIFNFPIGYGITTNRLALVFGLFAVLFFAIESRQICVKKISAFTLGGAIIAAGATSMSLLIAGGSLYGPISWIFLGLLSFVLAEIISSLNENQLQKFFFFLAILGVGVSLYTIVYFLGSSSFEMRRQFRDFYEPGMSRFMNALAVTTMIGIVGTVLSSAKVERSFWLLSALLVFLVSSLALYNGSRQTLLAITVFAILFMMPQFLFLHQKKSYRRFALKSLFMLVSVALGIAFVLRLNLIDARIIEQRYLVMLQEHNLRDADVTRLDFFSLGLDFMIQNYGFGVGFGNFAELAGGTAHNGYFGILGEMGIISGSVILVAVIATLWLTAKRLMKFSGHIPGAKWAIVALVATILLMNMFNGLIRDPLFFAVLGVLAGLAVYFKERNPSSQYMGGSGIFK